MEQLAFLEPVWGYVEPFWLQAKEWLISPAAWSQFALLIAAYVLAVFANRLISPRLTNLLTPKSENIFSAARRFVLIFLPLLLPLLAYGFTAIGEQITASLFGSSAVIAFGKRVFIFLAARALAKNIITDPFLKLLGKFVLVPAAALYALGIYDPFMMFLADTVVGVGNIQFSILSIVRGVVFGSILFWLGQWSNGHSNAYIEQQPMKPATRQLASKAAEFAIFGLAFILLVNILGISLGSLAVLGGAIGVGLGFGLQKIASNFISGVILLLEGQATVGDYVELDGGEAGTIIKMMARATILETYDGKWIVVPNEDFIVTRVVNYSDSGSANRLEANFSVSYDTDINKIPAIIQKAVGDHPDVLSKPEPPDCELRGFGESGIDFCVEFWVEGIDDGKNRFTSDILFVIWNALRDNDIKIPYPHRVVEFKGTPPDLSA